MEIGVHLPVMGTGYPLLTATALAEYARRAEALGFAGLAVSEHFVHRAPWLDALTALTVAATVTSTIPLVTAVVLPALRPPAVLAKTLGSLDALSGGRVVAGLGAGASDRDYTACAIPFAERWRRLDASIPILRAWWTSSRAEMTPDPAQPGGPPIWIGSWGSVAGLGRAARLGDGWIGSAFNTTPAQFSANWETVQHKVAAMGRDPTSFTNALASLFFHVSDHRVEAEHIVRDALAPALGRPPEELLPRVLTGGGAACAERLAAFAAAGVQRIFLWPIVDPLPQIERLAAEVLPRVSNQRMSNP